MQKYRWDHSVGIDPDDLGRRRRLVGAGLLCVLPALLGVFPARADAGSGPPPASPAPSGTDADPRPTGPDAPEAAADRSPEGVLKAKGLKKSHTSCILFAEEDAVGQKLKGARTALGAYQRAMSRYQEIAQAADDLEGTKAMMQQSAQYIRNLRAQAGSMGGGRSRRYGGQQMLNSQLNGAQMEQNQLQVYANQLKAQQPTPKQKQEITADLDRAKSSYEECIGQLRDAWASLVARYGEVAQDRSVREAIEILNHQKQWRVKLGPSHALAKAVDQALKEAREAIGTSTSGPGARPKAGAKAPRKKASPG